MLTTWIEWIFGPYGLSYNTMIVLVGTGLLGANAGLIGTYAVLRGRALTGDALAHAALPGLCLGFVVAGERNLIWMLVGALVSGSLGVAVIAGLRHVPKIRDDAAIGLVLSVFFGAGVVLSRIIQNSTTNGSKAGLDSYILGKTAGMIAQDVYTIGGVALFCLVIIVILFKEFLTISFDPAFASVQGVPARWLDFLMMSLVAVTVVIGLPAVGVVLMAALLILPGVAARFWSDQLTHVLGLASVFGLITGLVGTILSARHAQLPAGPIIVLTGTALFVISFLLAPRRGLLARLWQRRDLRQRLLRQNLLLTAQRWSQAHGGLTVPIPIAVLAQTRPWPRSLFRATTHQLVRRQAWRPLETTGMYAWTISGWQLSQKYAQYDLLWHRYLHADPENATTIADLDLEALTRNIPPAEVERLTALLRQEGQWPDTPMEIPTHPQPTNSQGAMEVAV